jgi:hypothetical protein
MKFSSELRSPSFVARPYQTQTQSASGASCGKGKSSEPHPGQEEAPRKGRDQPGHGKTDLGQNQHSFFLCAIHYQDLDEEYSNITCFDKIWRETSSTEPNISFGVGGSAKEDITMLDDFGGRESNAARPKYIVNNIKFHIV